MTHQLRVVSGPGAGQVLPISAGYLYSIGRGADAQLSIPTDTTLSRAHAEVYFDQTNNAWLLKNKSQHGTLLNGEVFNDHRYIQVGTAFQVGDSGIMFQGAGEAAPAGGAAIPQPAAPAAGAPAAQPAMGAPAAQPGMGAPAAADPMGAAQPGMGAPAAQPDMGAPGAADPVGAPVGAAPAAGAPAGDGGMKAGEAGAAAGEAAGAAFGAAAGALGKLGTEGGSAVTIEHTGDGYPFKELVMGGLSIVRSNLIPSVILLAPIILVVILNTILGFLELFSVITLVSLLMPLYSLALWLLIGPNYAIGLQKFQESSEPLSIGTLISFSDLPHKIKSSVVGWVGSWGFGLGAFAFFIQLEHPNASPVDCIKLGYKWGIANLVPTIILGIVLQIVMMISFIACGIGGLVGFPTCFAAFYLAYRLKKNDIVALAGSEGINLG